MSQQQIIALAVTAIGVGSFLVVFTILFANFRKFSINEIKSGKRDIELIQEYFHSKNPKVIARRKANKVIRDILFVLFLVLVLFSISFTLVSRFTDKLPIGTKTLMVVATDSMSVKHADNDYLQDYDNQFQQYSIIVLEKVDPNDLQYYDVIAFNATEETILIHRIVGIEKTTTSTRYVTRGDKYAQDDPYKTLQKNVVGRYTGVEIPFLGAIVLFLQAPAGLITMGALLLCMLMFDSNSGQISKEQQKRTDFLLTILDIDNMTDQSELSVDFVENIYLDKVAYSFSSEGLVSKDVATEVLISHHRLPPQETPTQVVQPVETPTDTVVEQPTQTDETPQDESSN